MTKGKAIVLSIVFAALAVSFYAGQSPPFTWITGIAALLFFSVWIAKFNRDSKLIERARQERQAAAQISETTPPMISKGSCRLFVPPPLREK